MQLYASIPMTRNFLCTGSPLLACAEIVGLCYLNDDQQPVIGLLPQQLWVYDAVEKTLHQLTRQADFQYVQQQFNSLSPQDVQTHLTQAFPISAVHDSNANTGFQGGLMGYISYDFAASQHILLTQAHAQPQLVLGQYDAFLRQDADGWYLYSPANLSEQLLARLKQQLDQNMPSTASATSKTDLNARWSFDEYAHAFQQVQDYLVAGDCYQINLTQEFRAQLQGRLLDFADTLWQHSQAPYEGYLTYANFELLSASPELFIEFRPQRKLVTRPIKGTMPRHPDPDLDLRNKQQLAASQKDQAENVMIVDLLRNDFSHYAEIGTVKTNQLFEIESFAQVHHMVSEIEATLKAEVHPLQMLFDALPGGSITGAPKIRAMQIIDELEQAPRGAYCGSLGYLNWDGTGRWNILIRSLQKYQDQVAVWAGGGITIASDCHAEYQECFDKVSAILNLFNTWDKPE